jgi:PilZ domain-containing protein
MASDPQSGVSRRRHARVRGPFDGWRLGLLVVPVTVQDLSVGGCFVNSTHAQRDGAKVTLKIELPSGAITVKGESLYQRPGGFAVRFVDLDAYSVSSIAQTVADAIELAARQH